MKNKPSANEPDEFEQQLSRRRQTYELLSPLGEAACQVRFSGSFQGKSIIWDAYLQTLAYYVRNREAHGQAVRQFIEVGTEGTQGRHITIGLNLPMIDEPVILKTIIMVRQYKRLAPGRHEYGEWVYFPK